jgi:3-dehydroshikimate dehydratase
MSSKLHPDLVSVTFRKFSVPEIVNLCVEAKLEGIEWGGDIHVPAGDIQRAKETRQLTIDHGLQVAAYGSYYRLGTHAAPFEPVLETAHALGSPTIRVWAGTVDSQYASEAYREEIVLESRSIAGLAEEAGISISYEFHPQTLTDTAESAVRLLQAVGHPNVRTLWQPPIGTSTEENVDGLSKVLPWLGNVHVFHWFPKYERHPLSNGKDDWKKYISLLRSDDKDRFLLLEFVQDDALTCFQQDASTLLQWLEIFDVTTDF